MKEYIERAAALDVVKRTSGDYAAAWSEIAHMPAADLAEVRHGHWIAEQFQTLIPVEYDEFGEPVLHDHIVYRCSQCGRVNHKKEPYCNCGARMDKEDRDG